MPAPKQHFGRLAGRAAIVTGGGGAAHVDGASIGSAIAVLYGREGAAVCVVDQDEDRARYTVQSLEAAGADAFAVIGDVSREETAQKAVSLTLARTSRIDVLVNNAAIRGGSSDLTTLEESDWERVMAVNLKSAVLFCKYALSPMVAQGSGVIINISSIAASVSHGSGFIYASAKAGLDALTRDIAVGYGRHGVRANSVSPGHMFTPMVAGFDDHARNLRRGVSPLGIEGDAWDVASAALFLASDEARFVTGQVIAVDGGVTATSPVKGAEFTME